MALNIENACGHFGNEVADTGALNFGDCPNQRVTMHGPDEDVDG